jgi:hypothetical protein
MDTDTLVITSADIAQQVRIALSELLELKVKLPQLPSVLEGLPLELWLQRIIPVAVAAELLNLTPETILKKYRSKLILLDGRKFGMRLADALLLRMKRKRAARATNK